MDWKKTLRDVKEAIPTIYLALRDRRTPLGAKLLAGFTLAYALSPIDLIPDFIPFLGYLDDLLILPLLIGLTRLLIPRDIWEDKRAQTREMGVQSGGKKLYYSLPVLLIWGLIIFCLYRALV